MAKEIRIVKLKVLGSIHCANCRMMFAPTMIFASTSEAELISNAKELHAQATAANRVICSTPKLTVIVQEALKEDEINIPSEAVH